MLWDMDGTIIDSEPIWLEAELAMLRRYGLELADDVREDMVGSGLHAAAEKFRAMGVPMAAEDIVAEWAAFVRAGLQRTEPAWRPGAPALLASLREAGIPSVLVTMSVRSVADTVIGLLPEGTFAGVIAGDEVEFEKPHPDPYLRGAALAGVDIADCVAIEDSRTGLTAAYASGAVAVGVPHLLDLSEVPAHAVWESLEDVDATHLAEAFAALRGVRIVSEGAAS